MKPIRVRWSDLSTYEPIEIYIDNPAMGKFFMKGDYILFKAFFDNIDETKREFVLVLPSPQVMRTFRPLPIKAKNCEILKLRIQKEEKGRLRILDWEIVK